MSPESARAISKYLSEGGKVSKLPPAISVTATEIVEYLQSKGVDAKFTTRPANANYHYRGKAVTLKKLANVANSLRRKDKLAPFAADLGFSFAHQRARLLGVEAKRKPAHAAASTLEKP